MVEMRVRGECDHGGVEELVVWWMDGQGILSPFTTHTRIYFKRSRELSLL